MLALMLAILDAVPVGVCFPCLRCYVIGLIMLLIFYLKGFYFDC